MENKRNAYEIIGTSRDAVYMRKSNIEKDKFVKQKAKDKKRDILKRIETLGERKKELETRILQELEQEQNTKKIPNPEKNHLLEFEKLKLEREINELKREIENVEKAYLEIMNAEQRNLYDAALDTRMENFKKEVQRERNVTDDAYKILFTSRKTCDDTLRKPKSIDALLLKMHDGILKNKLDQIEILNIAIAHLAGDKTSQAFRKKSRYEADIARIQKEIDRVEDAYKKIKTKEARDSYERELKEIKKQEDERNRQSDLRKNYKIAQYYNPNLIDQVKYTSFEISEEEKIKQEKEKKRKLSVQLVRKDGTEVTVERIGELEYRNIFNQMATLDAYRITRTVNGEKKWDVRYTNLNMGDLSRNPKTGELQNKEYYDFVANVFLSEDSIEGTKYNEGYLGEALKNKDGDYFHDLRNVEELSAVMKFYEIEKKNEEKEKESKKGEEHEQ